MVQPVEREDTHFYLDNVPPEELQLTLRVMSPELGSTADELAGNLLREYGFKMQRDHTYSPRRAYDLGLAQQARSGGRLEYRLTTRGVKVQSIVAVDSALGLDVLHFLHYTGYMGDPQDRKYLWSYRLCCELVWAASEALPSPRMAAEVQARIEEDFPSLPSTDRIGARFDSTAAGRLKAWLRALRPSPLPKGNGRLMRRRVERHELALLALDDLYRSRRYRYGDPVLLADAVLEQVASVFFLDTECCLDLLRVATRVAPAAVMSDTLAGPAVNLLRAYTIEDL